ncbi:MULTISPECIES: hypothetical protein [unclassified Caulobacter]|nr:MULTISPECIES: hypothetical protein [unclassified Caulobacter]
MSTRAARIAAARWPGLAETSLRVLLVVTASVAAAIFVAQSF